MHGKTYWREMLADFLVEQPDWSESTRQWYRWRLRPFVTYLIGRGIERPAEIELRHVKRFLAGQRQAGLSWSTRTGTFTALAVFFRWLKRQRLVETDPFTDPDSGLRRPRRPRRVPRRLEISVIERILETARRDNSSFGRRGLAVVQLLLDTGIRREELTRLRQRDISWDSADEFNNVPVIVRGKGDNERIVWIGPETQAAIRAWLDVRPKTLSQSLFVTLKANGSQAAGQSMRPNNVNKILVLLRDRAGLPPISVSPHRWRHTFASELASEVDISYIQLLLGHSSITTTRLYVSPNGAELRRKVAAHSPGRRQNRGRAPASGT